MPELSSTTIALLIEPTFRAIRQSRRDLVGSVLREAQAALVNARRMLRGRGTPVDEPSYELGVASTFTALLSTASERSVLADATRQLGEITRGLETLHQVALLNYSEQSDASQSIVAEKLGDDPGNFSRRIKRLSDAGLVNTERRGRRMVCSLSPLGLDVLSDLRPGWRAINPSNAQLLAGDKEVKAYVSENWLLESSLPAVFAVANSLNTVSFGVSALRVVTGPERKQQRTEIGKPMLRQQVTSQKIALVAV